MYAIRYYQKADGERPVAKWLSALDSKNKSTAYAKIVKLGENGLLLLKTEMLTRLVDSELYELRGGQCRIAVYHDKGHNDFVLLHGWLKKKKKHPEDIETAETYKDAYLSTRRQ